MLQFHRIIKSFMIQVRCELAPKEWHAAAAVVAGAQDCVQSLCLLDHTWNPALL
jgi:hypothetical protein